MPWTDANDDEIRELCKTMDVGKRLMLRRPVGRS
jgi:hypothetical protein